MNRFRTMLVVVAQRVELLDLSQFVPQQSDYVRRWRDHDFPPNASPKYGPKNPVKRMLWSVTPGALQRAYEGAKRRRKGTFDPAIFKRVDPAALIDYIV
jgi:hypothetical protein